MAVGEVGTPGAYPRIATSRRRMVYGPTQYWYSWTGNSEDRQRDHVPDLNVPLDSLIEPPNLLTMLYPLGHGQAPCICSLLVRKDALQRIGGFEDSFPGYYEDQAFLTKVYLSERVFVSSGCWDKYRIHPDSCSAAVARSGQARLLPQVVFGLVQAFSAVARRRKF